MKTIKTIGKIIKNIIAFIAVATVGLGVYAFTTAVIEAEPSVAQVSTTTPEVKQDRTMSIERVMNKHGYAIVVVKASHKGKVRCTAYDSSENVLGTISTYVTDSVEEITFNIYSDKLASASCGYR